MDQYDIELVVDRLDLVTRLPGLLSCLVEMKKGMVEQTGVELDRSNRLVGPHLKGMVTIFFRGEDSLLGVAEGFFIIPGHRVLLEGHV
jgi:hypothetical protein